MDIGNLIAATKEVHKFVEVGALAEILSAFGDVEHKAAQGSLLTLHLAKDKRAHVLGAVEHLRSAHCAYEESIKNATDGVKEYLTWYSVQNIFRKTIFSRCLMAVCYRYLEEESLAQETIDRAIEIERAYLGNRTIRQIGFFKSMLVVPISLTAWAISVAYTIPFSIWRKLTGRGGGIPSMDSAQLLAFKAAMSS